MHFNGWAFNYPYSFRGWKEEDWKSYIDILSYQNVNLLYLWPFMEIMPVPLSKEDQAYLEECNRVVEYVNRKITAWKSGSCSALIGSPTAASAWPTHDCGPIGDPNKETSIPAIPEITRPSWIRARRCTKASL